MARMPVLGVVMLLAVIATGVFVAEAQDAYGRMSGRKFTINNIIPFDGTPACPPANPNTVAFYPSNTNPLKGTVKIVGQFDAASIGVCDNSFYAVPPTTTISYEVYGDWIVFRVPGRVASALKLVIQKGNVLASVSVGNSFYVSVLTDVGKA